MLKLIRATLLVASVAASAAHALPVYSSRFVDDKSGYVVQVRDVGGALRLSGRHPESGATFRLKVSTAGRVVGEWNGKPVDYVLGAGRSDVELAQATAAAAGAR
jgi:hypothetical protein